MAFYPFADGAALHRPDTHRLFVLNASSAVLWCLLEEHDESDVLVTAYAEHFRIPRELAEVDVQKVLEQLIGTRVACSVTAIAVTIRKCWSLLACPRS